MASTLRNPHRPLHRAAPSVWIAGLSGIAFTLAAAVVGWPLAAVALGAMLLLVHVARIPFALSLRPSARAVVITYAITYAIWFAADAWRVLGPIPPPGSVARGPEALTVAGWALFTIVTVWAVLLRGRPRLDTFLDGLIFVAAIAAPVWLVVVEPAGSNPTTFQWVLTSAGVVTLSMFAGALYVLSGGIWNTPAVLVFVGGVANVAWGLTVHLTPLSDLQLPRFVPGYVIGLAIAFHPDLPDVLRRGGRDHGVSLTTRVWLLLPAVALPLLTLEWCFVNATPIPTVAIGASLLAIAALVAVRAALLARAGVGDATTARTMSITALLVAAVAVSLTLLNQSARLAQAQANHASLAVAAVAAGDLDRAKRLLALDPSHPSAVVLRHSTQELARRQQVASDRARDGRLFTVATLMATLGLVGVLLLRFNGAQRRMELQHQRTHDDLTGLPNRIALIRQIRDARPATRIGARTLVLIDLDDFKAVNDSLGYLAGDHVIKTLAARLEERRQRHQLLARVDGDAFALLLPPGEDPTAVAHQMLAAFDAPIPLPTGPYPVCGSIGIAMIDEDDDDRHQSVFRNAELAMYEAKRRAGNSLASFASDMYERALARVQLAAELREALDRDALHLVYQPIVDLAGGQVVGYEALVRWIHPDRGFLSPAEFIPIAEQSSLIVDLGGWVLRTATRQLAIWDAGSEHRPYLSVNVAASQLTTRVLGEQVTAALSAAQLDPARVLLEVTETSLMEEMEASVSEMERVRALGVRFALDDFGTGYSSLSYLRRFPVDVLKVDKSFVDDLHDPEGEALVQAIITMASSLRLVVVAEGVEQLEQVDALRSFGCDLAQGYYFSRPLPADDVPDHPRDRVVPASPAHHPGSRGLVAAAEGAHTRRGDRHATAPR